MSAAAGRRRRLRWWREIIYIGAFYAVYSGIRIRLEGSQARAFANAELIIRIERALGTYHEEAIQDLFLPWTWFIRFWNVYYGSLHFVVSIGALVWCYRRMEDRYPLWRNTLACTTGLALVGFATFPLMPPRLLPARYGYVDTLEVVGGLWAFSDLKGAANNYAAMPSLHIGWSAWCACVLLPAVRPRWAKALVLAYPVATLFAIVVTANHFWLDAVGGLLTLGAGYLAGRLLTTWVSDRPWARAEVAAAEEAAA